MDTSTHTFFDLQINGFAGVDFQDPALTGEQLRHAVDALLERNITRILFTLITDEGQSLEAKFRNVEALRAADPLIADVICGYHLEGPYLNPEPGFRGAHPEQCMKAPDLDEFRRWQDAAGGRIRLLTLAPEWEGSPAFIESIRSDEVYVAFGHTNASASDIDQAIAAGATLITHLGNGIPQQMDRHNNVVQRLLARDELTACLIPDGIHLPPFVLQNFFRAKPKGKAVFVSDCMSAAAMPAGRYKLAGMELEVGDDRVVRQPGKTNFAGSALTLDEGYANARKWLGLSAEEAHDLCGRAAAAVVGL